MLTYRIKKIVNSTWPRKWIRILFVWRIITYLQPWSNLNTYLGTEIVFSETIHIFPNNSFLIIISTGKEIVHFLITTTDTNIVFPCRTRLIHEVVIPIKVTIIFIFTIFDNHPRSFRIFRFIITPDPHFIIIFIIIIRIVRTLIGRIKHIIDSRRIITASLKISGNCRWAKAITSVIRNTCFIIITRFCCNQNYSISCTSPIYSSRRSIFQYTNRLHIIGIHCIDSTFYTIN